MDRSVEEKMMNFMKPMFGDMARKTIENQKEKLNLTRGELTYEQYAKIVDSIYTLCMKMAGAAIADKMRNGLLQILDENRTGR
ncbi:MAG: hypothetical protein KKH41_00320 [Candidatus Thermoplasmatota archaeon]|nr:hypothetical protein [Euryarchaeota archaeon]MBU4031574.1 hypothetical protein [Candidatus Thermoplasmatota archaeon]MBU4070760.1 hypothetical protein [Candidatus Thermoplasmatota archaeon]MBU4144756.1 hypothetical protein [Candidatus Thermoplasmatota archaeon]MBU4591007.1 hypothetical protein [Candidatus Thermoplasmatota archaeon]